MTASHPAAGERRLVVRAAATAAGHQNAAPPAPVVTEVIVGSGCLGRLEAVIAAARPRARRQLVVVDAGVAQPRVFRRWAGEWGPDAESSIVVPAGEDCKTRATHERLEDAILDAGLTRDDVVVAVGGGAALDVAGFAAATARRGIPWLAAPTSVVAQADACLGGKTAINHARGKNLLGTFHPPFCALVDVTTLRTLPTRDRVAGLAEIYKTGVVGDATLLATIAARGAPDDDAWWIDAIARSLAVKARLVEADERDEGVRRSLNYGHTVGHALETALGTDAMRHGEAVAIGMGVAAEVARGRDVVGLSWIEAQDAALARLGLPTRVPPEAAPARLLSLVGDDKKRRAGGPPGAITMVLPQRAGGVVVVEDVLVAELEAAIAARRERRTRRRKPT